MGSVPHVDDLDGATCRIKSNRANARRQVRTHGNSICLPLFLISETNVASVLRPFLVCTAAESGMDVVGIKPMYTCTPNGLLQYTDHGQ